MKNNLLNKIALMLIILLMMSKANAQPQGEWTWMHGSSSANAGGNYGTQGVFAPTNNPPCLYEACEWTDKLGNFWLFGGSGRYSNLWKFDPTINQYAWMKGPQIANQPGVYGTQGVASMTNNPGARAYGMASWVDTAGDFWMFGGIGYDAIGNLGFLNDLWKYQVSTNEWIWMKGPNAADDPGSYGTMGVEVLSNCPPSRAQTNAAWTDKDNNLWLFGGNGNFGKEGDMWKYNPLTNNWVWMKGPNIGNQPPVFGTRGVADPANNPGGRAVHAKWKDGKDDLWFFAGSNNLNFWGNDVWKFNIASNNWTWIGGTNVPNDSVSVGSRCADSIGNMPAGRVENRACWTLGCNIFVSFGGAYYNSLFNDLWSYDYIADKWTFMKGSFNPNAAAVYGTIQVSNAANVPGARVGCLGWKDNSGNLWMFGGITTGVMNDMWRFAPDTTCPHVGYSLGNVTSAFVPSVITGCSPLTVNFTNTSINSDRYSWNFGDTTYSSLTNPSHTFINPGTYTVKLISYTSCFGNPDSTTVTIVVKPSAHASFNADSLGGCLSFSLNFLNASTAASTYLWSFGDGNTSTATNPAHTYNLSGIYSVTLIAYAANGCNDTLVRPNYITVDTFPVVTSVFVANPVSGCSPLSVNFTNSSINGRSHLWNFGDGNHDTAINPVHIYTDSGTYTISLVSIDTNFCGIGIDTATFSIHIDKTATAAFSTASTYGCVPFAVSFLNNSSNASTYSWNFGDTHTSSSSNPSNTYTLAGIDTVTLIAYGANGCNDTIQKIISVINAPVVTSGFFADTIIGCNPLKVTFTNTGANGTNYHWLFGDNDTSSTKNPIHTYTDSGKFTVTLVTTNDTSVCGLITDTTRITQYIDIQDSVFISSHFTVNPSAGCSPLTVTFLNPNPYNCAYLWNFGNGFTDTAKNPISMTYLSGNYHVSLTAASNARCASKPSFNAIDLIVDSCYIFIPNIFSPNKDGYNDLFTIQAPALKQMTVQIFNRWGQIIYSWSGNEGGWDGYGAAEGTYFFTITGIDINDKAYSNKGFITLIR